MFDLGTGPVLYTRLLSSDCCPTILLSLLKLSERVLGRV
jgi:hypothetical protein